MEHKHTFIGYKGDTVGTDKDPIEYRGFLIYERILTERNTVSFYVSRKREWRDSEHTISSTIWAVVKDGKEVSQLAGPNGAKLAIDKHLSGESIFNKLEATHA